MFKPSVSNLWYRIHYVSILRTKDSIQWRRCCRTGVLWYICDIFCDIYTLWCFTFRFGQCHQAAIPRTVCRYLTLNTVILWFTCCSTVPAPCYYQRGSIVLERNICGSFRLWVREFVVQSVCPSDCSDWLQVKTKMFNSGHSIKSLHFWPWKVENQGQQGQGCENAEVGFWPWLYAAKFAQRSLYYIQHNVISPKIW